MSYSVDSIARIAHAANRELQAVQHDPTVPVSPPWDELDEETRGSIRAGVVSALGGTDPETSHEEWCAYKREHGWTYGPVKDADAKTHPCLVDYDELPESQRVKDDLFLAIVDTFNDEDPGQEPLRLDERHPSIAGVLRFLDVNPRLDDVPASIARLARMIGVAWADVLPESMETTTALRKLLEAKDAAVRSSLDLDDDGDRPTPADPQGSALGVLTSLDGGSTSDEVRHDAEHALGETRRAA